MIDRAPVLFLVVLGCGFQVHAQWNGAATYNLGMGMGPVALMTGNLSLGSTVLSNTANSGAATTGFKTGQSATELVFKPNPTVSADLRQKFEQVMLSRALPGKRDTLLQQLSKLEPVSIFNSALQKSGFSPYNIADVATAYVADSWQIMNGAPDPPQATLSVLDQQLRRGLLASHALAKLSNGQKQQIAEFLAYEDVLNTLTSQSPDVRNDPSRRAKAQDSLASQFKQLIGLDLRHVDLTPSGLSVRP